MMPDDDDIFTIPVRRCKRCGGILISQKSVQDGYGHTCKQKEKAEAEARMPDPDQVTFDEFLTGGFDNNGNY